MTVTLLHHTPLDIADFGIGKCWGKGCMPTHDKLVERMDRVANQHKHSSTIEHLTYNFDIDGISRACLQELARHRIASYSVKSSRYTLRELRAEEPFFSTDSKDYDRAAQYLVYTGNFEVDRYSIQALEHLRSLVASGISNDYTKYAMPESFKTSLVWSINARSLQNFLSLRTSKAALWEIRYLANAVFNALPADHQFLFTHIMEAAHDTSGSH